MNCAWQAATKLLNFRVKGFDTLHICRSDAQKKNKKSKVPFGWIEFIHGAYYNKRG